MKIRTKEDISVAKHTFCVELSGRSEESVKTKMKTEKAIGQEDIPIEAWKCLEEVGEI